MERVFQGAEITVLFSDGWLDNWRCNRGMDMNEQDKAAQAEPVVLNDDWTPPKNKQDPIYIVGKGWQCDEMPPAGTKLYTEAPAVAQEPVVWECKAGGLKSLTQKQYDKQPDKIKAHYTLIPAVAVNEQLLCALTNLRQVVRERNSLGMDWMDLFDRLMEALLDSESAIEAAEKMIGEP